MGDAMNHATKLQRTVTLAVLAAALVAGGVALLRLADLVEAYDSPAQPAAPPSSAQPPSADDPPRDTSGPADPRGEDRRTFDPLNPTPDDVDDALWVATRTDDGDTVPIHRWEQDTVTIGVYGPQADDHLDDVADVAAWLTDTTGVHFTAERGHGDPHDYDIIADLGADQPPRAHVAFTMDGTIQSARVTLDATHQRWLWEEFLHAAGPAADHPDRDDTVLSNDQTQQRAGAFDQWVLEAIYTPDDLPISHDDLRQALTP